MLMQINGQLKAKLNLDRENNKVRVANLVKERDSLASKISNIRKPLKAKHKVRVNNLEAEIKSLKNKNSSLIGNLRAKIRDLERNKILLGKKLAAKIRELKDENKLFQKELRQDKRVGRAAQRKKGLVEILSDLVKPKEQKS